MMSFTLFQNPETDPFLATFEEDLKKYRTVRSQLCKKLCFLITIGGLSAVTALLAKKSVDIKNGPSYESQGSDLIMVSFCALLSAGVTISTLCCCIRQFFPSDNSDNILIRDLPLPMQNNVSQLIYQNGIDPSQILTVGDVRFYCKDSGTRELRNFVA